MDKNKERCANCKFLCDLYTPPAFTIKPTHEPCCTLLMYEGQIMKLDGVNGVCECFMEKET